MPGSTLPPVPSNMMRIRRQATLPGHRFGTTIIHGVWVLPTNHVLPEAETTMEVSGLEPVQEVI